MLSSSAVGIDKQMAPRTGFFYDFKARQVLVKKWDKQTEGMSLTGHTVFINAYLILILLPRFCFRERSIVQCCKCYHSTFYRYSAAKCDRRRAGIDGEKQDGTRQILGCLPVRQVICG